MNRILCPTDFSEAAENAIRFAIQLAEDQNANVEILSVMTVPVVDAYTPSDVMQTLMENEKILTDAKLKSLIEKLQGTSNCKISGIKEFGFATEQINKTAKSINADLIVMGTHGESKAINRFLGTVSYGTVKHSEIPVLVIPEESEYHGFTKIVVAHDHKEKLDKQLDTIYSLSNEVSPDIDILTIREEGQDKEACILNKEGGVCVVEIHSTDVSASISAYIEESHAHLLAVKRHQRGFIENLFHRSTIKKVLGSSVIPVLVIN